MSSYAMFEAPSPIGVWSLGGLAQPRGNQAVSVPPLISFSVCSRRNGGVEMVESVMPDQWDLELLAQCQDDDASEKISLDAFLDELGLTRHDIQS